MEMVLYARSHSINRLRGPLPYGGPGVPKQKHLKLLLLGKSGAGKTTFLNSCASFLAKAKYEDPRVCAITQTIVLKKGKKEPFPVKLECNIPVFMNKQTEQGGSSAKSQTAKPNIYDFQLPSMNVTLIDTPGLGDTNGIKADMAHCDEIARSVAALGDFEAILFIHNGSESRLDLNMSCLLSKFKSMLPKKCVDNIIFVFTHVPDPSDIKALDAFTELKFKTEGKVFSFENLCLIPADKMLEAKDLKRGTPQADKQIKKMTEHWEENASEFKKLVELASKMASIPGKSLVDQENMKTLITRIVHAEADLIKFFLDEKAIMAQRLLDLEEVRKRSANFSQHTSKKSTLIKKKSKRNCTFMDTVPLPDGQKITQCLQCKKLCHNPCHLDNVYTAGHIQLKGCAAFNNQEKCNVCSHSYEVHQHATSVIKAVTKEVEDDVTILEYVDEVNIEAKTEYDSSLKEKEMIQQQIDTDSKRLKDSKDVIDGCMKKIAYLHHLLQLNCDYTSDDFMLKYIDTMMEMLDQDKSMGKAEKHRQKTEFLEVRAKYQEIKQACEASKDYSHKLTNQEIESVDNMIAELEAEQAQLIASYQQHRVPHKFGESTLHASGQEGLGGETSRRSLADRRTSYRSPTPTQRGHKQM